MRSLPRSVCIPPGIQPGETPGTARETRALPEPAATNVSEPTATNAADPKATNVGYLWLVFAFVALFGTLGQAQTVNWEADPGNPSTLRLVFTDCTPDGDPELPAIPGATLSFLGSQQSTSIVNFQVTRTATLSYLVRSRQSGPIEIPAFSFKTNRGAVRVPAYNAAAAAAPPEALAASKLVPDRTSVWAGEVFGLNYELSASRRNNPQVNQTFDWNPAPLVAEDWSKPEITEAVVNGERRLQVVYRTRVVGRQPNTLRLEAASHLMNIQTGNIGFGIFQQPRMEPVSVTSDQPVIEVKPLPPSPAGFSGAVGQFTLESKVIPERATVGEPVTWTLELNGTGNWPDIAGFPSREVSTDFQVVQPQAKRTPADGKLFDATLVEDVVLVPTKTGSYPLGPVAFTYFDPSSGSYQTLTVPRTTLTIAPPAAPQFNVMPEGEPGIRIPDTGKTGTGVTDSPEAGSRSPVASPAPPAGIPRDPLPGMTAVSTPLSARAFVFSLLAPVAGLLLFWFGLAMRQARRTDPVRPRREARIRIVRTLADIQHAEPAERHELLLAWQRDSAVLWQVNRAAPPASAIEDPAWRRLWLDADRTLYGDNVPLPVDWIARAQEAAVGKALPAFKPWRLFLPQNLMPFAALLACGLFAGIVASAVAGQASARGDALAAYREGNFAAAEKIWRARLADAPTDWIARHNLGLALAQLERNGEAAAHASVAFAQRPNHPSVDWHFRLATARAGFAPGALVPFLRESVMASIATLGSPAWWQRVAIAGAILAAAALGWILVNAYGAGRRGHFRAAGILFAVTLVGCSLAIAAWRSFGLAANGHAVTVARNGILRSIPTEADTAQKTTSLAAGSMAIADHTFLGWTRLQFENGQTGWVRKEEVVGFWK